MYRKAHCVYYSMPGVLNYIPCTWTGLWYYTKLVHILHLSRVLELAVFLRVSDLRVGGRHLALPLYKLKPSVTYFNWIIHLKATPCLHCHCTSKAQNDNQSCSWGRCHVNTDWQVATAAHYSLLHRLNMTTLPLCYVYLECVLSLWGNSISVHRSFAHDPLRFGRNLFCG